jgi:hypothetical protein
VCFGHVVIDYIKAYKFGFKSGAERIAQINLDGRIVVYFREDSTILAFTLDLGQVLDIFQRFLVALSLPEY